METTLEALRRGLEHQRAGRLEAAIEEYTGILNRDPANADAHHLLGMAAHGSGRHQAALVHVAEAIRLRPEIAPFHNNLGHVLHSLGRPQPALLCFEHALLLDPRSLDAMVNLGNALQDLERPDDAVAWYGRALEVKPDSAEAFNNLGNALVTLGRAEEAIGCFESAVRIRPDYAEAYVNWSSALKRLGRLEEAADRCREALRRAPSLAEAYANLGAILSGLRRYREAEASALEAIRIRPQLAEAHVVLGLVLERQGKAIEAEDRCRYALALRPGYAEAHNNLGCALQRQGRLEEAISSYREAIRLDPALPDAHYNLGNAWRDELRLPEARSCYERALELDPSHVKAHWNLALTQLLAGDFPCGWEEFEWRWKKEDTPARIFGQPLWDGSPLQGRTVLLHAEQGLGDTIQFIRYAPLVKALGATVIAEVQPPLAALLAGCRGVDRVVAAGSAPPPPFDLHLPLLSLPRVFGAGLGNLPAEVPYLELEPSYRSKWRQRLAGISGLKAGLVWAGNPEHAEDHRRSMRLEDLAPLAAVGPVSWFSLQYGPRAWEASAPPAGLVLTDLAGEVADFRDLAAAMLHLDLVISVDTAASHVAGALGRPVWILLPYVPDWRWLTGRGDSPWYPTARLFRQSCRGDWASVMDRVVEALWEVARGAALTLPDRADMSSDG